jgi:hypothetical protein
MLLSKVLDEAPRARRRWRVYTRGAVTVLRRPRGREPERTLTSIVIVKHENWTELSWVGFGRRYRWNATALETDDGLCGCDPAGEIFFERRGAGNMRCWDAAGRIVGCDRVEVPPPDPGHALEAMLR